MSLRHTSNYNPAQKLKGPKATILLKAVMTYDLH